MHLEAKEAYDQGDYQTALAKANDILDQDPNDPLALFFAGAVCIKQGRRGLAYNLLARAAKHAPDRPEIWVNYGRCQDDTPEGMKQGEFCFRKAIQLSDDPLPSAWSNLGSLMIQQCRIDEAEKFIDRALSEKPDYEPALKAKGFIYLHKGEWEKGWRYYEYILGTHQRIKHGYQLPDGSTTEEWDGTPGKKIMVYGEQGIGDELMYSSVIPDAAKENKIIIDGMSRLAGLLQRSFPDTICLGSRWNKNLDVIVPENLPDVACSMGGLCKIYRNKEQDFPGTPYLKADPDMRVSMRALLDSLGPRTKIGIAWTGGSDRTRGYLRTKELEDLVPLLRQDADFISLQYNDHSEEIKDFEEKRGIKIHDFPWITLQKDYDYTAALVAELDLVISVPTSVVQLAGGLGIETLVIVPNWTGWLFGRNVYPWASSVKVHRTPNIKKLAKDLKNFIDGQLADVV